MKYYCGVDLGASFTKVGIVDECGKIIGSECFATKDSGAKIAESISSSIISLKKSYNIEWSDVSGMGIGCPAPILDSEGTVSLTNLPVKDFDLIAAIQNHLQKKLPARLINDANAAALAEYHYGAARGFANVVLMTIGTGIGGGIIINGKLYVGSGAAGELGHIQIVEGGRQCACGGKGCLESYASTSALIRTAQLERSRDSDSSLNNFEPLDGKAVFKCYFEGDNAAQIAVDSFVSYLSVGIKNISNILSPDAIILGGGVSALGEKLLALLNVECMGISPTIRCATLKNDAGIIGAARFVSDQTKRQPS